MLHVFKDHDERVPVTADPIELDNVLMLQVGEQLCLPLEILAGCQSGVFQSLEEGSIQTELGGCESEGPGLVFPRWTLGGRGFCRVILPVTRGSQSTLQIGMN